MAPFTVQIQGVDVSGEGILPVIAGMGIFRNKGTEILERYGIVNPHEGSWHSMQAYLDAFKLISEEIGPNTLRTIGGQVPEHAQWPPEIDTIEKALASIDAAYHQNHRLKGRSMFNPATGKMLEGIGNYTFEMTGERASRLICSSPYPCDFDTGLIEAVARKFRPVSPGTVSFVFVKHDDTQPCRKKGGESCTYEVTW